MLAGGRGPGRRTGGRTGPTRRGPACRPGPTRRSACPVGGRSVDGGDARRSAGAGPCPGHAHWAPTRCTCCCTPAPDWAACWSAGCWRAWACGGRCGSCGERRRHEDRRSERRGPSRNGCRAWPEKGVGVSAEVFHRLGVALGVVLALAWLLRWIETVRRERRVRRRLARLLALEMEAVRERGPAGRWFGARGVVRRWLPVAGAVGGGWVLVGGVAGVVVGLVAGVGLWRWRLRRPAGAAAAGVDAAEAARQLPLAADLLAACIAAGAGPVVAAQAVGEALAGPVGEATGAGCGRGAARRRTGRGLAEAGVDTGCRPPGDAAWNGPTSRAYRRPGPSRASPRTPVPTGGARRRNGPGGRPSWSRRRWGCASSPRSSRSAYCPW